MSAVDRRLVPRHCFVEQYVDNAEIAARITAKALPRFGYRSADIEVIDGIIMATKLPQSANTLLEQILADANLDLQGRDDYWLLNQALRDEMAEMGIPSSDEEWHSSQLRFLQSHRTASARGCAMRASSATVRVFRPALKRAEHEFQGAMSST